MKRGQSAIEFLAITAFGLLVLVPLLMYIMGTTPYKEYQTSLVAGEESLNKIVSTSEVVGVQPPGSSIEVDVKIPINAEKIVFKGHLVNMKISYGGLTSDIVKKTFVEYKDTEIKLNGGGYVKKLRLRNEVINIKGKEKSIIVVEEVK